MQTKPQPAPYQNITAAILAGGRGSRLGGADKGLEDLSGRPLIAYIIDALEPQSDRLLINANRNLARYEIFGYPVVTDASNEFLGPLAGILSVLDAVKTDYALCVPCDAPLLPDNLTERLWLALVRDQALASVARNNEGLQPVYALLNKSLTSTLRIFLDQGGRKTGDWLRSIRAAEADCSDYPQMFLNMNSDADRANLQQHLQKALI